ncbi:ferritin-like protein [Mesorhizobium sp. M1307]|uniref:ferritin-like domain-containing protein n=1 Tax=Mesorhizobium sp. M1307 TaxID=2957079 RepID=UPI003334F4F4
MFAPRRNTAFQWIRVHTESAGGGKHEPFSGGGNLSLPLDADINLTQFDTGLPIAQTHLSLAQAIHIVGIPNDPSMSPEDELISLLQNAAEVEHGLMLQYLYASYSATNQQIAGQLRQIAIEEMGHFISVQNLLTACGKPPYLGHSDWDSKQNLFQPYPFRLEPLSVEVLAKFTIGEMPDRATVPKSILPDLPEIEAQADLAAGGSVEAHRVGLLYMKIYWLLRDNDLPLPNPADEPWKGFPVAELATTPELAGRHVHIGFVTDASALNAQPEHWKGTFTTVIVKVITGPSAARDGIAEISAQGEGFEGTTDDHFERFVDAWRAAKSAGTIANPIALNPYYGAQKPEGGGDRIDTDIGILCAKLGDQLYELALLCIAASLLLSSDAAPVARPNAAQAAIFAMRQGLGEVARVLRTLPVSEPNPTGKLCGLPFSTAPIDVAPTIGAVLDRADAVVADLHSLADQIGQSSEEISVMIMAQGVTSVLDDDIMPRLQLLRS